MLEMERKNNEKKQSKVHMSLYHPLLRALKTNHSLVGKQTEAEQTR